MLYLVRQQLLELLRSLRRSEVLLLKLRKGDSSIDIVDRACFPAQTIKKRSKDFANRASN